MKGFKTQVFLLVMLPFCAALALTVYTHFQLRKSEMARANGQVLSLVQHAASNQEAIVAQVKYLFTSLAQLPQARGRDRNQSTAFFAGLLKLYPDFVNFGIVSPAGELMVSAVPAAEPVQLSDRTYFRRAIETGEFSVGDYQIGKISGKPSLNFAYPVTASGTGIVSVVFGALDLRVISEAAGRAALPADAVLTILDSQGRILARSPDDDQFIGRLMPNEPYVQKILETRRGVVQMRGLDQRDRLYAFVPIGSQQETGLYASVGIPSETALATAHEMLRTHGVVLICFAALAMILAREFAHRLILRPIGALVDAAQRIAKGEFSMRSSDQWSSTELVRVSRAFNDMAAELQRRQQRVDEAYQEISALNDDLERRVRQRTAELQETNSELESFSYSVSHDLRAPLRHMTGFAQLLKDRAQEKLDEKERRYLTVISEAAKKMGNLIDDLLTFSRIGRQTLRQEKVDMDQLVNEIVSASQEELAGRTVEWRVDPLPCVAGDGSLLRQVWVNLLANAIKYTSTREVAAIHVGCESTSAGEYSFFVRDNGVGFDSAYVHKLFAVFQRLHRDDEFEGTGIGLANVRRIVVRHGGRVWAEGELDKGAAFYFSLPIREEPAE